MNESLFDIHTDYLSCSFGLTTATGLCRLLDGEINHDQVTRLLSSPAKTSADLWRVVKPLVRQVESEDGVLIFDDSIEEKPYTDENDLVSTISKESTSSRRSIRPRKLDCQSPSIW